MSALADAIEEVLALPPTKQRALSERVVSYIRQKGMLWVPNPGSQTEAFYSDADEIGYGGEAGPGKLLSIDTPLPTPTGWTTMGEVQPGDWLIDKDGMPCA